MTLLADLLATVFDRPARFISGAGRDTRTIEELTVDLVRAGGEVAGLSLARDILDRYAACDDAGKRAFFAHLVGGMDIDFAALREALDSYQADPGKVSYRAFMAAAEPPRQELIRRLNMVPGATALLVRMRADLLRLSADDPVLGALDLDFRHLFASWFNRGFLVLRPISWESPAHILEKIIAYEAVHAITSWDDLRRRLEPEDRRCFAFFHPAMPDEPLIFVEVALTRGSAGSIPVLLAEDRRAISSDSADTAVFYSISNCQAGLAGISFGNFLIKQVAGDLSVDLPQIRTYITLSPIPGLRKWLDASGIAYDPEDGEAMRRLAARYLLSAKRGDGLPLDPVARFHLGNGAAIHAIHADADRSARGLDQSAGTMVNYLYDLAKVSANHERFAASHDVAAAPDIKALGQIKTKTAA